MCIYLKISYKLTFLKINIYVQRYDNSCKFFVM